MNRTDQTTYNVLCQAKASAEGNLLVIRPYIMS